MKPFLYAVIISLFITVGCKQEKHSADYIKKNTGRYLINDDEVVKTYFIDGKLFINWRGAKQIKPLQLNDTLFFIKAMNKKLKFGKEKLELISPNEPIKICRKLAESEKIPSEYLAQDNLDLAIKGYLAIQQKDSLSPLIDEYAFNRYGYKELRAKHYQKAIQLFKINVALYPKSANVYDSLGEAYLKSGDTINAISNYQKSVQLNSDNRRGKNILKKLKK
ncbi:MAG: tetratricopeptide repeat protein [Lutibacter sp.]